jgi:hypothetical protein
MKVFEVLRKDLDAISEEEIASRLSRFNWDYEFQPNLRKNLKELEILENLVYQVWKKNPEKAVQLWNENTPYSQNDKTIVPSFIFRLQAQDELIYG